MYLTRTSHAERSGVPPITARNNSIRPLPGGHQPESGQPGNCNCTGCRQGHASRHAGGSGGGWRTGRRRDPSHARRRRLRPACSPCQTKVLARSTASGSGAPCASRAAMAADRVQPVPCVWRVSTRGPREALHRRAVVEIVDRRIAIAVPALDQHRPAAERVQCLGLRGHLGIRGGLPGFQQARRLGQVGRDEGGERQQRAPHRLDGIGCDQGIAAGRHHHRIDHQRAAGVRLPACG